MFQFVILFAGIIAILILVSLIVQFALYNFNTGDIKEFFNVDINLFLPWEYYRYISLCSINIIF